MTASLFHTFARKRDGRDQLSTSLLILQSILEFGLLLVPEEVRVPLLPGIAENEEDRLLIRQVRISFTNLNTDAGLDEIRRHASVFGPITVEIKLDDLREAGVLPVYYFPSPPPGARFASDLGFRILADLHAITKTLHVLSESQSEPLPELPRLLATLRGVASIFYPADTLQQRDLIDGQWRDAFITDLRYFQQREWRLIGGIAWERGEIDSALSQYEQNFLKLIDSNFFHDPSRGFDGRPKVHFCRMVRSIGYKRVKDCIVAIYASAEASPRCKAVLEKHGFAGRFHVL